MKADKQARIDILSELPSEVLDALWVIYEHGFQKGQMLKGKAWLDGYDACQDGLPRHYDPAYDHKVVSG